MFVDPALRRRRSQPASAVRAPALRSCCAPTPASPGAAGSDSHARRGGGAADAGSRVLADAHPRVIADAKGSERRALPHDELAEAPGWARRPPDEGERVASAGGHDAERYEERGDGDPDGWYQEEEHLISAMDDEARSVLFAEASVHSCDRALRCST